MKERPSPAHTLIKVLLVFFIAISLSVFISRPVVYNFNRIQEFALRFKPKAEYKATAARIGLEKLKSYEKKLEKDQKSVQKKLSVYLPKGPYLIINTSANSFRLMNKEDLLREGMCSTGSYTVLQGEENNGYLKLHVGCLKY